jgi:hypothetical protein
LTSSRRHKGKAIIKIEADQYSSAEPFPDDFYQALQDGGWTMMQGGVEKYTRYVQVASGKDFQGVMITFSGEPIVGGMYFDESNPVYYIGPR